jgi:hypothetical protein
MRKNVFLPNGNNKSTFQPEGAAPATSSLKSSYIKNEEKLSKERGTLKMACPQLAGGTTPRRVEVRDVDQKATHLDLTPMSSKKL